jgi:hypothetical protein
MIPLWGSGRDLVHAVQTGDGFGMALNAGFLVWDVASVVAGALSFGTATAVMMGAKTGIRAAVKAAGKVTAKMAAKKAAQVVAKSVALRKGLKGGIRGLAMKIPKVCVMACFPAGTPIAVKDGYKNIEEVKEGDLVWAWNEQTGDLALKPVVYTMRKQSDALIEIGVADETIRATPEHPFWVDGQWKEAGELQKGDELLRSDGFTTPILHVTHQTEKPVEVYNFEVADWHTYLVGYWMWIVHNTSGRKTVCLKVVAQQAGKQVAQKWEDLGTLMHCFVAGTPVHTPQGTVPIEQIQSGDAVYAFNMNTWQRVIRPVGEVYRHWTEQLAVIETEEGSVRSTAKHRFWVENAEAWIVAADLVPGMTLRNVDGEEVVILKVTVRDEKTDTFNFEVMGEHNYFAGPSAVLVHNQNPPSVAPFTELDKLPLDKIPKYIQESEFFTEREVIRKYSFYEIRDIRGEKPVPVYVGQTVNPLDRERAHVNTKLKQNGFDPKDFDFKTIDEDKPMNPYQAHAREQHYLKERGTKGIQLKNKQGQMVTIGNKINAIGKRKFNWLLRYIGCP